MTQPIDDGSVAANPNDSIILEASDRWKSCQDWQGVQDERTREDIKFANADARNAGQWPQGIYENRTTGGNDLPCLTINITRPHNDLIINQISKNGFGCKIKPTGGKASYRSAQVMESLIRRIQYISKGSTQRRKVCEQQVDGGIGYMLIETAYVSNKTRDQDIFLKASRDPTGVYLDPWIQAGGDGLDANFGFVFDRMPRKEFNRKYPEWKDKVGMSPIGAMMTDWISDKEIVLAKYYRKKKTPDTFVWYEIDNGDGKELTSFEGLASEIKDDAGREIYKALMADIKSENIRGGTRKVFNDEVEWFLIAGDQIIDRGDWAGKYIPICRAVGREIVIDATLDRKGHTRPLIDAQRMLNYNASTGVQVVALQPKAPWMASARAIEGQEQWKTSNIDSFPVLIYNDVDDEAPVEIQKIDPPQRVEMPAPSQAYELGMQTAERHIMMISGQWQTETGQRSSNMPESGVAINERKEQGDIATYHFTEHLADMDCAIGIQLLDLIPKIYDTRRALHIMDEDGEKSWIQIDPNQDDVVQELQHEAEDEEAIKLAFNPMIGEYECIADSGADWKTKRQEAWNAGAQILQSNAELTAVIGDLLIKYGDFPGAEDMAERLKKEIKATKPYLFDENSEPQVMALQQQNQRLTALNAELMTKLADEKLKVRGRDERNDIKAFEAETNRMKAQIEAIMEKVLSPAEIARMQHDITLKAHDHVYTMIQQANQGNIDAENQPEPSNG